jgi:FdhE protein
VPPPAADTRLAPRLNRARQLAASRAEARAALEFYAELLTFHQALTTRHDGAASALAEHLRWLDQHAPAPVADAARAAHRRAWPQLLDGYDGAASNSPSTFIVESLIHAFPPEPCPHCSAPPVVSLLREAGHGSRRSYVCGTCLKESPALRLGCRACGEKDVDKLPVYRTDATDPARIDACDTCRVYLKTIDLTKDGAACAVADDLASVSLDLWAREQGYRRERPNLLRL